MMIVRTSDLPFVSVSRSAYLDHWELHQLKVNTIFGFHFPFVLV